MKRLFRLLITIIISIIFLTSSVSCIADKNIEKVPTDQDVTSQVVEIKTSDNATLITDIETAVAKAYDSVVVINASSMSGTSSGSGVIIGASEQLTYIVTCCHVVENFSNYVVTLNDGTKFSANLVGGDPETDLAVISIETTGLTMASFIENSDTLKVGSDAIAIGNPLGTLGGTVTKGIVSSTSRNITTSDGTIHNLIQTDAAINSGNSGGGLFNNQGNLIGIVSAKYAAAGIEGLAFAIPANLVRTIATDLIEHGYIVGKTSLGVTFTDGYYRGGSGYFGGELYPVVYVSYLDPYGSAKTSLKLEDIIVSISVAYQDDNKEPVSLKLIDKASQVNDFLESLELNIGDKVTFTIKRGGYNVNTTDVEVILTQYIYK